MACTIYGKIFEWENFRTWYANDHSRENFCGYLMPSRHFLHETYGITYSIKIHRKIFTIGWKLQKLQKLSHSKVLPYTIAAYVCVYAYLNIMYIHGYIVL